MFIFSPYVASTMISLGFKMYLEVTKLFYDKVHL